MERRVIDMEEVEETQTNMTWKEKILGMNKVLLVFILIFGFFIFALISTLILGAMVNMGAPLAPRNFVQMYISTIAEASTLILISVGLTMTTRIRKFGNFSHSEFLVVGAYSVLAITQIFKITNEFTQIIFVQLIIAFLVSGMVGVLGEILIFGPLINRNATPLSLMVASIGYGIIIRQVIQEIFTGVSQSIAIVYPKEFTTWTVGLRSLPFIGTFFKILFERNTSVTIMKGIEVTFSQNHVWGMIVMIITVLILRYIFNNTTLGMAMRATSDDVDLAEISGINTRAVILWSWFLAAGVTGMGALFLMASSEVNPTSGFARLLIIFAIVTLGGFDSFEGTLVSGFIIVAMKQFVSFFNDQVATIGGKNETVKNLTFWSTSGDWSNVAPFTIIILVLILRPRGLFGLVDPKSKL